MWIRRVIALVLGAALAGLVRARTRTVRPRPTGALAARGVLTDPPSPASRPAPPAGRARRRRLVAIGAGLAFCALLAGVAAAALEGDGEGSHGPSASRSAPVADTEAADSFPEPASAAPHELARSPAAAASESRISPGAPSDAQVRRELRQLERYNRGVVSGLRASGGSARLPADAPDAVRQVIAGGNAIARFPYRLGGGHGSFVDDAYDCSGSVSYALAAAGLLDTPLDSGRLEQWGVPGRGRWITVFANPGHVFMEVAGLRFDTSGRAGLRGSRWQETRRPADGFAVRHWPGL